MRVLVAVDDSKFNEAVVEEIGARPWPSDTAFLVFHVVPAGHWQDWGLTIHQGLSEKLVLESRKLVADKVGRLRELVGAEKEIAGEVAEGRICDNILRIAAEWHADLILMGSHGRTGLQKFVLGSVAQDVLLGAPCSVEFIRPEKMVAEVGDRAKKKKPLLVY